MAVQLLSLVQYILGWIRQESDPEKGVQASSETATTVEFDVWPAFLNMVIALAVVVGLIIFVAWLLKALFGAKYAIGPSGFMQVLSSVPLGERRFISVVRAGERYFLIGITSGSIKTLAELEKEEVEKHLNVSSEASGENAFARILRKMRGEGGGENT